MMKKLKLALCWLWQYCAKLERVWIGQKSISYQPVPVDGESLRPKPPKGGTGESKNMRSCLPPAKGIIKAPKMMPPKKKRR